jgi:hypothetical protein
MLDDDLRSKKIKDLGETGGTERKRPTEAQKQRELEEAARRTLDDIQIPALPTFDTEYYEDEVDDAGVQNPDRTAEDYTRRGSTSCERLAG